MLKRPSHPACRPLGEKRTAGRPLCSDLVLVRWTEDGGALKEIIAVLEEYSSTDATLFTGVALRTGARVTLLVTGADLAATVRRCVRAPNGYLAGLAFEGSNGDYVPDHLLDTTRLEFDE
jgi:hypothetical protein